VFAIEPEGIEVSVSDQGIGISPEALPIIFQAFRRGDVGLTDPAAL
jgi:signal transduction histidine kinase